MIYWMSNRTKEVLDYYNVEVIGFDPEKSAKNATCQVTYDGLSAIVSLGDVSGLDSSAVDIRFAAAMHRLATEMDERVKKLYDVSDALLGVKELPQMEADPTETRNYTFSMKMGAEYSVLARSLAEAEEKAREWMDGVRVIKMPEAETEDYMHMDEFSAQQPTLVRIEGE